jgi:F-type H+-transporting ATPase subunit gamma
MANLKEVRNRITSVTSTMQITSAMKMVSAAKLRRAQDAIVQMRPYANKLKDILSNLSSSVDSSEGGSYTTQREPGNVLIVMITSNRGLAGAFNTNVIKATNQLIASKYSSQFKAGKLKFMSVGKKSSDFINRNKYSLYSNENSVYDSLNFDNVSAIAQKIMDAYSSKEFDRVELVYNAFRNAAVQIPTIEQYLPVLPPEQSDSKVAKSIDYIFAPSKEEIITELIPKSLKIQIYKAVLDSHAAEHGARMTAMNKATDNARDLIKELKLSYNKARQAAITNEILEIVGGAEALEG